MKMEFLRKFGTAFNTKHKQVRTVTSLWENREKASKKRVIRITYRCDAELPIPLFYIMIAVFLLAASQ
jgi:hypothetical protein